MIHFVKEVWQDNKIASLMMLPLALLGVAGGIMVVIVPILAIANGGHPVYIP